VSYKFFEYFSCHSEPLKAVKNLGPSPSPQGDKKENVLSHSQAPAWEPEKKLMAESLL
jgi:hypothetical protein